MVNLCSLSHPPRFDLGKGVDTIDKVLLLWMSDWFLREALHVESRTWRTKCRANPIYRRIVISNYRWRVDCEERKRAQRRLIRLQESNTRTSLISGEVRGERNISVQRGGPIVSAHST